MAEQKIDVSTPSPVYIELEERRALTRDLLGGTPAMKRAGRKWLPEHPGEIGGGNYNLRLAGNVLTPFTAQAIDKANGKLFAKQITLTDVPPQIAALMEDFDLQGRDFNAFAMDATRSAWADGVTYILADEQKPDKKIVTAADRTAANLRPYAVHIKACCLLDPVVSEMIGGKRTITRIRIKECTQVPDGKWGYREQERIRVLERWPDGSIIYQIWEEQETANGKEWVMIEEDITAMKQIYLIALYTNRTGFMIGEPAFQATAELNLAHWRVTSELQNTVTMSCFEMLAATGVTKEDWSGDVGPNKIARCVAPDGKFYWLSPSGSGAKIASDYLKDIEARIESAGASLRVERAGNVTATAAAIDSEEGCAGLKAVAECNSDALELLLQYFAEMLGLDTKKAGSVAINTDFGAAKGSDAGLTSLDKALALGKLSEESYFEIMGWRGETPSDFDIELNRERLAAEGPSLGTLTNRNAQGDI